MADYVNKINQHYGNADITANILVALKNAGKDTNNLTRDDISDIDEFHFGGIHQTRYLAQIANLQSGMHVLDVGSGLGGPARTLAAEFGCQVTGIDLTAEYCRIADLLTKLVGLSNKVKFQQADALKMKFAPNSFDVVWTQFAGMNISARADLYRCLANVLRSGGRFAFHEVLATPNRDLHYPVFWADDANLSFLKTSDEILNLLTQTGFQQIAWEDLTGQTIDEFRKRIQHNQQAEIPILGLNVVVTRGFAQKGKNILRNLEENRMRVVMGVFEKV